ncbi:hypothetical protein M1413_04060 [Patescibacteria group bacterium]|nr:hypothetical protein [Patescibacteria group bacterium]MCL5114877.1 hypothetical protein [Patescibacteria group bacterium]
MNNHPLVRKIYLYLFSLIGLVLAVTGLVRLVDLGLRSFVFTAADQYSPYPATGPAGNGPSAAELQAYQDQQTTSNREREASESLAFLIVGIPLYWYHWRIIKKEKTNVE